MLVCEGVGDAAKSEGWCGVEGGSIEGDETVPAGGDGNGEVMVESLAGDGGEEVWVALRGGFEAEAVAKSECVVVDLGVVREVEGAGCCVCSISGGEEGCYVFCLRKLRVLARVDNFDNT